MVKNRSDLYHYLLFILVVLLIGVPAPKPDYIFNFIDNANFLNQDRDFISAPLVGELGEHSLFFPEQNVKEVLFYSLPNGFSKTNLFKYPLGSKLQVREDGLFIVEELTGTRTKLVVQRLEAQAVIKNETLGSFVSGINAASESLVLILDGKKEVINCFHYLASTSDASTSQSAVHSLKQILRMIDQTVPSYLKARLDNSNSLSTKALALVNTNKKTNEQISGFSTELEKIKSLVISSNTSLPDEARNNLVLMLELLRTDGQKAISNISGTSDNYNLFMDVLERVLDIFKQDFIKSKDNILLETKTQAVSQSRRAKSIGGSVSSLAVSPTSSNLVNNNIASSSIPAPNAADAQNALIRRNIFFRGLLKEMHPTQRIVVNLEGEILYAQRCRINNDIVDKWVRRKTETYECAPEDISDISIAYSDEFDFKKALERHGVDQASPLAFELFKRLISAMRTYYSFTSQRDVYYGETYHLNLKQSGNYYKLTSAKYDNIYITDKGVFIDKDAQRYEIIKFNTNPYYLFSLLTEANFEILFTPSSVSSILASYYQEVNGNNLANGHIILGRGLKNIKPAYFYNNSRYDVAGTTAHNISNDRSKFDYHNELPPYQRNIEDFGLMVGSYVNVSTQRRKVNNIKFYIGTREIGQYAPLDPLVGLNGRKMTKNAANFCTVDLQRPADNFSSIVIPGVTEVFKLGNRISFTCPNIANGTSIRVILNNAISNIGDPSYYGYFKAEDPLLVFNNLPSVPGNVSGEFVSFDLFKAEGYSQGDNSKGEVLVFGFPCKFVTEAVVHSRLRLSTQPLNSKVSNQINSSGYCQFRNEDLFKIRIVNPAGGQGPAWEGKAVLEDLRRVVTVDKTAPLKKNFATNLGKISSEMRLGGGYQVPFGPDYWLKTNRGDLVFKGDIIYLYDSVNDKFDPIYAANWKYNNVDVPASYGSSDSYEILNPILSERGANFIEAYTATITPYSGPRIAGTSFIELRQSVQFYVAGVNNVRSVSVNIRGVNYTCGNITRDKNSLVRCDFGGLNVERTCSASQISYDVKSASDIRVNSKVLDGKAPTMNACILSVTTRDNRVIKLPLVETPSIYPDSGYFPTANSFKGIYQQTLPNKIYYIGSKPPQYLRLSGGYAAFGNSSVTVNGSPCVRPENIALGKVDDVGCYFKWDGVSTQVLATIKIDGEIIRSAIVALESTSLINGSLRMMRDIGINRFEVNMGSYSVPIQGIKSVQAGTRNCDFPLLTLPASGSSPRMSIPFDGICYFSVPTKASYLPVNNATVINHEDVAVDIAFTEKGFTPTIFPPVNSNRTIQYLVEAVNDSSEKQEKYNNPLIFAQNPLTTNTCEQACLSRGLIFDNLGYDQNFCSTYRASNGGSTVTYQGAGNVVGRGCQTYITKNTFNTYAYRNWSPYSPTMTYRPSTQQKEGRICPCLSY